MAVRWTFPAGPALASADGPTVNTAVASPGVDASPTPLIQIPPIWELGMRVKIHAGGWMTSGSATPTVVFGLWLAKPAVALASATLLCTTGALAMPASVTQGPWLLDYWGRCTALSTPASATAGQVSGRGRVLPVSSLTAFAADAPLPATYAGRLSSGFDTTFAQNLLFGIIFSVTTGSPSMACEELTCELIG
jgi:hypothetical protein